MQPGHCRQTHIYPPVSMLPHTPLLSVLSYQSTIVRLSHLIRIPQAAQPQTSSGTLPTCADQGSSNSAYIYGSFVT
jgi:hypothetical protein